MKWILLALTAGILTALWVLAVEPVPTEVTPQRVDGARPRNVIFILSDDHRYDAMSFLGHEFARTPVMDSMAKIATGFPREACSSRAVSPSKLGKARLATVVRPCQIPTVRLRVQGQGRGDAT